MPASPSPAPSQPLLDRVLDPAAPRTLKLAAARGALPLEREALVLALVRLGADADPEIAHESGKTLSGLPSDMIFGILQDAGTDSQVLDHFARRGGASPEMVLAVVANPAASEATLLELAGSSNPEILDRIVINETRLAASPELVGKLKANPALSRESRRRILELEEHVLGQEGPEYTFRSPSAPEAAGPEGTVEDIPIPLPSAEEMAAEETTPLLQIPLTPEEQAAEDALRRTPVFQQIVRMSIPEKIHVAVRGNAEERAILIRDPSRLVATTVLKSAKVSDREVENFANLRSVHDEVLRMIGNHREWTKSYGVVLALARNPRTPTGISLTMLNRLGIRDLKIMGQDKNIPEVIRRSAKRLYELRTQPQKKAKGK